MKKLSVIVLALMSVFVMASCKGPKGDPGNANVGSSTVLVRSSDWYWENTSWRVDIDYAAINVDIHDYGAVLVYMNVGDTWRQLPMTFYYTDVVEGQTIYCSSSLEVSSYRNGVSIFWTENDFYDGYRPDEHRFKIVVIAASYYASRTDVNYSDYEAVKTAFQLKDDD